MTHRANLKKWKKLADDLCTLCKESQTLSHVLNCCSKALNLRRYTERHDSVLRQIVHLLAKLLLTTFNMTSDLTCCTYNFAEQICPSYDLRPDSGPSLESNCKYMYELTVCFESNTVDASNKKAE